MLILFWILKFIGLLLAAGAGLYAWKTKRSIYKAQKRLEKLEADTRDGKFLSQFTRQELALTLKGYIEPSCSPTDPANSDGEAYLSDIREPVFAYMDRAVIDTGQRTYTILLADSGMGKTSFCIAYRAHLLEKYPYQDVAVVSLSQTSCESNITGLANKSRCILLLDALDEDPNALHDGQKRLKDLLEIAVDFQSVIVTCRSQFFSDDHAIPLETPIRKIAPRAHGQNQHSTLKRFYLSPFDDRQVTRYINRHFPAWNLARIKQRARARKLVADIPELAARPMLLERLPEIARGNEKLHELYQLYEFMVRGWADREQNWIARDKLLLVSREIAVSLLANEANRRQRITKNELQNIADRVIANDPDWDHLQTRSLLNRDSNGNFKFAHLSIMEFLVVEAALEGDVRALRSPWTAFMKQLLISWGYYRHEDENVAQAHALLTSPDARKAVLPLSDYWAMQPKQGMPNFKMSATRRTNEFGSARLAIPQWRHAQISIDSEEGKITVDDHEFFLRWLSFPRALDDDTHVPMPMAMAQKITDRNAHYRLPSYDEFISLVEGIDAVGRNDLLEDYTLFPISDSPGQRRHLLVSLGEVRTLGALARVVDKERTVSVTKRSISCYETGQLQDPRYASKIKVRPWWIVD
jgi:hypothetical protein